MLMQRLLMQRLLMQRLMQKVCDTEGVRPIDVVRKS